MENPASSIPASSLWGSLTTWFTSTIFFILLNLMIATILFTSNLQNNTNHQQQEDHKKQNPKHHPQIPRSPSILHRLKSFNFSPQKSQIENNADEHEPLHIAATEYVFNQPLHYQHFVFGSDYTHQVETVSTHFKFDSTRPEISEIEDAGFESDPTRKEDGFGRFESDPTRKEDGKDIGFGFDPTHGDEKTDQFRSLDEVYCKLKGGGGGGHHDRTKSDGEIRPKPTTKFKKSASLKVGFRRLEEEKKVEARRPATVRERENDDVEVDSKADDFINKFKNDLKLQRMESIMKSKSGKK